MNDERRVPKTKYNNVVRESDIAMDPDYLKKKEFFDNLQLRCCLTYCHHSNRVVELKCNALRENTEKETKVIQNSLTLLISQLPSRVQKMKVVVERERRLSLACFTQSRSSVAMTLAFFRIVYLLPNCLTISKRMTK